MSFVWITELWPFSTYIFEALINGSVFLRLKDETSAYFSRGSILFMYANNVTIPLYVLSI
jgi:hypothetical protein